MKKKQTLALLLAGAMLVPNAFAASPEDFHDFPTDWSAAGLRSAVQNGLLNGSNGEIDGNGLLTRAQLAAIVGRAFGADKAPTSPDLPMSGRTHGTTMIWRSLSRWARSRARTES